MLAFMPHSPPLHLHSPMASTTMSLAILPSAPMPYNRQPSTAMPLPPSPSPSKRPKLSLNTTAVQPSVFGKGATSLRLETLSATSPTARNTFQNTHNPNALRRANSPPRKPNLAPLATSVTRSVPCDGSEVSNDPASSSTTISSSSAVDSAMSTPYKLSYNVTSILSNSPIPRTMKRRLSFTQVKPMFPAAKKVAFRSPLTEDIKTTKYIYKHSDIESSTSRTSPLELSPPLQKASLWKSDYTNDRRTTENTEVNSASSPQTGDKRESSDEEDSASCPATPIAGRRKRHRQWVWTLGPVGQSEQNLKYQSDMTVGQKA